MELGRALLSAPRLSRTEAAIAGPADTKFKLGDLLQSIPTTERERFAREIGLAVSEARSYAAVAEAWPTDTRCAASWTAHRELKDHPRRFELITPAMSMRKAREAAGKKPIDQKPIEDLSLDERAEMIVNLLKNKKLNEAAAKLVKEQGEARRVQRLVNAAEDSRSAEYKDALAALNRARRMKHPDQAALEVVEKIRGLGEYLRAVQEIIDDGSVGAHRLPEIVLAAEAAIERADELLKSIGKRDRKEPHGAVVDIIDVDVAQPRPMLLDGND